MNTANGEEGLGMVEGENYSLNMERGEQVLGSDQEQEQELESENESLRHKARSKWHSGALHLIKALDIPLSLDASKQLYGCYLMRSDYLHPFSAYAWTDWPIEDAPRPNIVDEDLPESWPIDITPSQIERPRFQFAESRYIPDVCKKEQLLNPLDHRTRLEDATHYLEVACKNFAQRYLAQRVRRAGLEPSGEMTLDLKYLLPHILKVVAVHIRPFNIERPRQGFRKQKAIGTWANLRPINAASVLRLRRLFPRDASLCRSLNKQLASGDITLDKVPLPSQLVYKYTLPLARLARKSWAWDNEVYVAPFPGYADACARALEHVQTSIDSEQRERVENAKRKRTTSAGPKESNKKTRL